MYGVNVPEGLDRKIKKLEKHVALLMEERKERMNAEKDATRLEITEEVKIKPKATKKRSKKKQEEPTVVQETEVSEDVNLTDAALT